jgi:hypothetical protein
MLLALLAMVGLGVLFVAGSSAAASATAPPDPDPNTGITPGVSSRIVTGDSGTQWEGRIILVSPKDDRLVEVIDRDGRTGHPPHMVIRYVQQGTDKKKRFLASIGPQTTGGLVRLAMLDFGVQGPIPSGEATPPNPSPLAPAPEGKIRVTPGTYEANVSVSFPASLVVTTGLLKNGVAGKGFTDVQVTDERPRAWTVPGGADYYVRATWPGKPTLFDRPHALDDSKRVLMGRTLITPRSAVRRARRELDGQCAHAAGAGRRGPGAFAAAYGRLTCAMSDEELTQRASKCGSTAAAAERRSGARSTGTCAIFRAGSSRGSGRQAHGPEAVRTTCNARGARRLRALFSALTLSKYERNSKMKTIDRSPFNPSVNHTTQGPQQATNNPPAPAPVMEHRPAAAAATPAPAPSSPTACAKHGWLGNHGFACPECAEKTAPQTTPPTGIDWNAESAGMLAVLDEVGSALVEKVLAMKGAFAPDYRSRLEWITSQVMRSPTFVHWAPRGIDLGEPISQGASDAEFAQHAVATAELMLSDIDRRVRIFEGQTRAAAG